MHARCWSALILVCLLFSIACGTGKMPITVGQWTRISEQTSCEVLNPAYCSGLYGFAIDKTGAFTAGPSPGGEVVQGKITVDELSALSAAANNYLMSVTQQASCQLNPAFPGVGDIITMVTTNMNELGVYISGGGVPPNFTCVSADMDRTAALISSVQQLRRKYYSVPFPS